MSSAHNNCDHMRALLINVPVFVSDAPNSGTSRLDLRINGWERPLRHHLRALAVKKPVLLAGDFNVAHSRLPPSDATHGSFLVRAYSSSSDSRYIAQPGWRREEQHAFTQLLWGENAISAKDAEIAERAAAVDEYHCDSHGSHESIEHETLTAHARNPTSASADFIDVFRALNPNHSGGGAMTWRGRGKYARMGMRLDYFIADPVLFSRIDSCEHFEQHCPEAYADTQLAGLGHDVQRPLCYCGSDHCPILLRFRKQPITGTTGDDTNNSSSSMNAGRSFKTPPDTCGGIASDNDGNCTHDAAAWLQRFHVFGAQLKPLRRQIGKQTESACQALRYHLDSSSGGGWVELPAAYIEGTVSATRNYRSSEAIFMKEWPRVMQCRGGDVVEVRAADCLDTVLALKAEGYNPVLLNMVSLCQLSSPHVNTYSLHMHLITSRQGSHVCVYGRRFINVVCFTNLLLVQANRKYPGGGWRNGAGAQEENIFRRSNCCHFLEADRHWPLPGASNSHALRSPARYPIAEFGGIYTPGVLIFRGPESEGYPFLPQPHPISMVATAAYHQPKLDKHNKLSPTDASKTKRKIAALLAIGLAHGHDAIVLSAFGCGAFRNPPEHVAELFKQCLLDDAEGSNSSSEARGSGFNSRFGGRYKKVVFAILDDCNAVSNAKDRPTDDDTGNLAPFRRAFAKPIAVGSHTSSVAPTGPEQVSCSRYNDATCRTVDSGPIEISRYPNMNLLPEAADALAAVVSRHGKWSAGLLMYRRAHPQPSSVARSKECLDLEVLLGKMGGPLWARRPRAWTIPKGEPEPSESAFQCAVREFYEETHHPPSEESSAYIQLRPVKQSNKLVIAWALEVTTRIDPRDLYSNMVPDQNFREIAKYEWCTVEQALSGRLVQAQEGLVHDLVQRLQAPDTLSDPSVITRTDISPPAKRRAVGSSNDGFVSSAKLARDAAEAARIQDRSDICESCDDGVTDDANTLRYIDAKITLQMPMKGDGSSNKFRGAQLRPGWRCIDNSLLIWQSHPGPIEARQAVAAFDFDGCVARTSLHSSDTSWSMLFPHVPHVIRALCAGHGAGTRVSQPHLVAVMSNESMGRFVNLAAIERNLTKKCGRIEGWAAGLGQLDQPVVCLVACGGSSKAPDRYRKPNPGMWDWLASAAALGNSKETSLLDPGQSFFVGDAAGRIGDHSDTDRQFASAVGRGLRFYNETDFFKNMHPEHEYRKR
eukprot:SAG31_NODE_1207_length_9383_cov_5.316351_4_plen_1216_part_00